MELSTLLGMGWKVMLTKAEGAEKVVQCKAVIPVASEVRWVAVREAEWWISYSGIVLGGAYLGVFGEFKVVAEMCGYVW